MRKQSVPNLFGGTSPFFRSFQNDLARMLDLSRRPAPGAGETSEFFEPFATMPAVDFAETDTAVEVSAEVPGVSEDDLDVTVQGDVLVIKGEKSSDIEDEKKDYHYIERRYGSFRRQIPLGFIPEEGAVSADFENGVLKLTVKKPKNGPSGVQKVQIGKS